MLAKLFLKRLSGLNDNPRKGKDMTTVRFAYYLNSESYYESLSESKHEEWSGFMRSFKVKQSQRITVNLEL